MKKRTIAILSLLMACFLAACGEAETTENTETVKEEVQAAEPVDAVIYYGNAQADGFETKTVAIEGLSAENLIEELGKVNVVSLDTEVSAFTQEGDKLSLDLSKEFEEYVSMMGTSGEYVVIGSLVDTFLTAYDAQSIQLTVNGGKTLETGHASYDKPQFFYEWEEQETEEVSENSEEPLSYRLMDEGYTENGFSIYYPQFKDIPDEALQAKWNDAIKAVVLADVDTPQEAEQWESYSIDYKIGTCDTEIVSYVFTCTSKAKDASEETVSSFALTFDMVNRKNVRLSDWVESEEIADKLAEEGDYKISGSNVDREAFDEFYKADRPTRQEYADSFAEYDYDLDHPDQIPEGYSYIMDDKLIVIVKLPEELGAGTAEIDAGVKVR